MSGARVRGVRAGVAAGFAVLLMLPYPVAAAPRPAAPATASSPAPAALHSATGSWIVALRPGRDARKLAPVIANYAGGVAGQTFSHALNGFVFKGSDKAAAALRNNPNVRSVVADGTLKIAADTVPTGVSRILANHENPQGAYQAGFAGDGVRVAILDTGIDLTHPDLTPNLDVGLGENCMTPGQPPQDGHGHGTHVAGTVAAADNDLGVIGVAPHARLVPFKVLDDSGSGEWSNLICAVDIITGYATDADPSNDIRVANMSLGDVGGIGTCTDGSIREAICTSVAAGVTYIAAAGNSTVDASGFIPAAFPEVIAVSAVTDLDGEPGGNGGCWLFFYYCDDTLAEFSNYGATIDVAAPGTQIYSDWTGGGYATEMGTSMASPHVAGVAALLLSAFPTLTPADIEDRLKTTGECPNGAFADADGTGDCTGKGQWGNDPDGIAEPLVNAVNALQGGIPGDRRPTVHITAPVDGSSVNGPIVVTATATDDVGVTKVEFSVNGVLAATDTDGTNGWSMPWDPATVDAGVYSFTAKATDTAGQTSKNVVSVQARANVQGNWVGNFGVDGYVLANWNGDDTDLASLPAGATFTIDQGARYTWADTTTEVRALVDPTGTERRSQTWYDVNEFRAHLSFAAAYTGTLHLYALDWDAYGGNRYETITVDDGHGPQTVQLTNSFIDGAWVHAPITVAAGGTVAIDIRKVSGESAVVAGLFLGGPGSIPPPPPGPPPPTVDRPGVQGTWVGNYGNDGYVLGDWTGSGELVSLPAGVTYTLEQGSRYSFAAPTTDVRALQSPNAVERRARTWFDGSQIRIRLTFASAYAGDLHLYALDWDSYGPRGEKVSVDDGQGQRGATLAAGSFVQGTWVHFAISVPAGGSVVIKVDRTAGGNGVLAGLFLGGPGPLPPPPPPPLTVDLPGVKGTWVGTYGSDGYVLANWTGSGELVSLPAGVTYTLEQGSRYSWAAPTTDVRALQSPDAVERRARTWFDSSEIRVRLTFTAAYTGTLNAYAVDWDSYGPRGENVSIDDGRGLRTASLAANSFVQGAWVHGSIVVPAGGAVVVTVNKTTGGNGVLSGLFLDPAAPATAPGAPTGLTATAGNGQVGLTWTAPSSDGGSPVTGYTATASPGGATCSVGGSTLGCTISGLTNGTTYSFTVRATNAVGTGPASAPATATPATVPGAPTGLTATPGNGQVALAWTAPATGGSPITGYTATASPGSATCSVGGSTLACTISGLTNGTSYSFTVRAANAIGPGPASSPATATPVAPATAPGAPTGLTATAGNGQVGLTWTAPSSDGGSPITGYTATASPGGATCSVGGSTLGCTISGLTNGTTYSFTVRATNAVGTGPASAPATATPATVPGAPRNLNAKPGSPRGVSLTWQAPTSNGGAAITGYRIYRSTSTGTETFLIAVGTVTSFTDTTTTSGGRYYYKVTAVNAVGEGPQSAEANARAK